MRSNRQAGFSLIELLIVVAIIGIIASIAIPNLLSSRRAANEGSAIQSLRTIYGCETNFQVTFGSGNYGTLAQLGAQGMLDPVLRTGAKSGYNFAVTDIDLVLGVSPASLYATAVPQITSGPGKSGNRRFGIGTDGVLHGDSTALTPYANEAAVLAAPPLGN